MNKFLIIQELGGASASVRYPGAIDVESFAFGQRQRSFALSQGLTEHIQVTPSAADLTVTKFRDAASERIWLAVTSGRVFSKAALIVEYSGSGPQGRGVMTMIMSSVQITAVSSGGASANSEILTLSFENIHISQTLRTPA